jgi:SulP family sulfate permease
VFDKRTIVDDLIAGTVVFLVALPLCLGVALASGAPLFSGIISGVCGGVVVTLISRSRLGVSGPAAGLAVIVAAAIAELGFRGFLLAGVVAGVLQLAAGFAKAGIIGHYFPSSVIKGMLAGIGVVLVLKQIPHAMGFDTSWMGEIEFLQSDGHNSFTELYYAVLGIRPGAVIVSMVALVVLIAWEIPPLSHHKHRLRFVPPALIVVILGVGINEILVRFFPGVALVGDDLVRLPVPDSLGQLGSLLT